LVGVSYFVGLLGFELVSKFSSLTDVIRMYFLARFGLDPDKLQKIEESLEKLEERLDNSDNANVNTNNTNTNNVIIKKKKQNLKYR
jgi:hypothetical protein